MEPRRSRPKTIKWALIIGIVIVLNLFFTYSISLVYKAPEYELYCPNKQENIQPTTKAACLKVDGQWNEFTIPPEKAPAAVGVTPASPQITGSCNVNYTCDKNFQADTKIYERNAFVTLIILGVVSIILGIFLKVSEVVTIGLALGGVLSLIVASMRYWYYADNILKVVLLAVALIALIWIGVKKFQE